MRCLKTVMLAAAVGGLCTVAMAQEKPAGQPGEKPPAPRAPEGGQPPRGDRGMGGQLSPEKAKAAWEAQATGVAAGLGLDAEKTKTLVTAYTDARHSQNAAMDKMREEMRKAREEGGGGGGGFAEMQKKLEEMNTSEREKFRKAIAGALSAEQVSKAMATLGTFNRQWDGMADAVLGFKLEKAKLDAANKAMEEYVASVSNAPRDDREAMRTAMQAARKKLLDTMKANLTEEQLGKFETAMGRGGMGPRGGAGGGDEPPPAPRRGRGGGGGG